MGVAAAETQFHVLAVDDSLIDRKIIERLLKTSSYQVTTVDSGSKALEILGLQDDKATSPTSPLDHEFEVNMIITDYCMPGMTGYDLLKKIKESSSLRDIPVVIMSSENVPSGINRPWNFLMFTDVRCLEEGAEEFLLKPVQLSDMKRLRPHILKGRSKEQQEEEEMQQEPEPSPPNQDSPSIIIQDLDNSSISTSSDTNNDINNKRKPMEEGLPSERTRPRFSKGNLIVL